LFGTSGPLAASVMEAESVAAESGVVIEWAPVHLACRARRDVRRAWYVGARG
jgi:hypothetical protein